MINIDSKTKLCGVIGDPVKHSLSPAIHNAAYQALGLNFAYLAFEVKNLKAAIDGVRGLGIRGLSVTIPHKVAVMNFLDEVDDTAAAIGAVNTVVNEDGVLKGYNTDWVGCVRAIETQGAGLISGKRVVILGAGGAARAVAYGVRRGGCASLTFLNRTISKAQELAEEFGSAVFGENFFGGAGVDCDFGELSDAVKIGKADIIVNTTAVGMEPNFGECPIDPKLITEKLIVQDIVYMPRETRLIEAAKMAGAVVITGEKMLVFQAMEQFRLFTGKEAPYDVVMEAVLKDI